MKNRRWILSVVYMVLGIALFATAFFELLDSFWSGMGTALFVIGLLRLLQAIRYHSNAQYREDTDTAIGDERNKFLSMKAWSWAGYLFVMIAAVATIVFKLLDMESEMFLASGAVCLVIILYWVSYLIVRKKY
ncbi:MAG: hypothetical protein IJC33_00500 [Clostridia bacterium]|nr:hypothetical protein [Clostridia bacterium]